MIESFKLPTITPETISGSICSFNDEYGGLPLKSCTSLITGHQEGSGTPSPDNVRPLHAFSNAILTATGENIADIADKATSTTEGIESTITDSRLVATGTSTGNGDIKVDFNNALVIKSGMSLTFTLDGTDIRSAPLYVFLHIKNGGYTAPQSLTNTSHSLTLTKEGVYDYMLLRTTLNQTVDIDAYIMIATTNQSYIPYNGNTYTFTFGQDIYQGSIDWLRGVVTGIWGVVDLGSLDWFPISNAYYADIVGKKNGIGNLLCSSYPIYTATPSLADMPDKMIKGGSGDNRAYAKDSSYPDASSFKTAMNGVMLAYELATPIEIPLGGINLLTQEGQNNIFCDTGDTEVKRLKVN